MRRTSANILFGITLILVPSCSSDEVENEEEKTDSGAGTEPVDTGEADSEPPPNEPPTVSASISDDSPTSADDLTVSAEAEDPDGDEVVLRARARITT